jgi:hypothetical protein
VLDAFNDAAKTHPKIDSEYEPRGSLFKRELVEKYMKAAPFMYRVSNPPDMVDLTDGAAGKIMNYPPSGAIQEKSLVANEPKINEFMINHGK